MCKYIDLDSVLFHSLDYAGEKDRSETSLIKLKSILESGFIYSRAKQLEKLGDKTELSRFFDEYNNPINDWNWNGKDHISLCEKRFKKRTHFDSLAYKQYVQGCDGIGFIFPKSLIDEADLTRWKCLESEYQFKDQVSLNKAMGVFCGLASEKRVIEELCKARDNGLDKDQFINEIPNIFYSRQIENYRQIKDLLHFFGYDLPIYSTIDGYEVGDMQEIVSAFDFGPTSEMM